MSVQAHQRRLIFLGPPASGKGTQAALISRTYGIPTASTGAMLRKERLRDTEIGREVDRITRHGGLAPDPIVLDLVFGWLERHPNAYLFDGFPRTLSQAEQFDAELARRGLALDRVVLFELPDDLIAQRVLDRLTCEACGATFSASFHGVLEAGPCPVCPGALSRRRDDRPEALRKRMDEYRNLTFPVVSHYEEKELLVRVDAAAGRDALFHNLCRLIASALCHS